MNYYPFHLGDYAAHTGHLEPMEDLAYRRLLDVYYMREGALPADIQVTAKLVRLRSCAADVESVLNEFFVLTEDGWRHQRCEVEIAKMQDKQTKARASAQASVNSRRAKAERPLHEQQADAERSLPALPADVELPTPTPTPTPINKEPIPSGMGSAPRKRSATAARPDDVAEPVWQDFQRLRTQKRAPLTDTALAGLRREAVKAGVGLEAALAYCCEQGWQGFNAGWYADRTGKQPRASPPAASFRERDAAAASERYRRLTGQDSPVVTEIQTMKAIAQ